MESALHSTEVTVSGNSEDHVLPAFDVDKEAMVGVCFQNFLYIITQKVDCMISEKVALDPFLDTKYEVGMITHCPHTLPIRYDESSMMHVIGAPKINPDIGKIIFDRKRKNMKYIK